MEKLELSEREKSILRFVIHQFILTASPVGSRYITRKYDVGLSPATVRNIMSDLEESGFLNHPHTSAGRIPTDKGYRFYVDSLMGPPKLGKRDKYLIEHELDIDSLDSDDLLQITSTILSDITNQLACITYPRFDKAILEKIQLVQLSSNKILVVLTINSGLVKTITLEIEKEMERSQLEKVERLLNERLSGLTFSDIRITFQDRIKDHKEEYKPIIRVFLNSVNRIFKDVRLHDKAVVTGVRNILKQPEFVDQEHLHSVIELAEDKDVIIHIMDQNPENTDKGVSIKIGTENENVKLLEYSLINKDYKIGDVTGKVGVVGPKRMEYSRVIAAVVYMADIFTNALKKQGI